MALFTGREKNKIFLQNDTVMISAGRDYSTGLNFIITVLYVELYISFKYD